MLFPTIDFALFFVVVFLGHWVLNHDRRAWVLFMIILAVTILLFGSAKYWVYYAGETRS